MAKPIANDAGERVARRARVKAVNMNLFNKKGGKDDGDANVAAMHKFSTLQLTDPFEGVIIEGANGEMPTLNPSYPSSNLLNLPNINSILRQCIDAYVVNIEGFGHRLEYVGPEGGEDSQEALNEKERIETLLEYPNSQHSLIEIRSRLRRDLETLGYAFIEVSRDMTGAVSALWHVPAHTVRMTAAEGTPVQLKRTVYREGKKITRNVPHRFRRFVQQVGGRRIYFKEFGDERIIDPKTGKEAADLSVAESATEIYHFTLYAPGDTYGLPRWINQLPSVLGMRESELTNLQFFKDNAIPAMAILVAGGLLTDDAVTTIEEKFTSAQGRESINRVVVIEAAGMKEYAGEKAQIPAPKLDIKPLADARQTDGMFKEYEESAGIKIRSAFRLPPLFLGRSEEMTHATAAASLTVAETQVFGPERNKIDDVFNLHLLSMDGELPVFWRFRSQPPRITNPEDVIMALETLDAVGAMTPNIAIGMANELFDTDIPLVDQAWGDYPIAFGQWALEQDRLQDISDLVAEKDQTSEEDAKDAARNENADHDDAEDAAAAANKQRRRIRRYIDRRYPVIGEEIRKRRIRGVVA